MLVASLIAAPSVKLVVPNPDFDTETGTIQVFLAGTKESFTINRFWITTPVQVCELCGSQMRWGELKKFGPEGPVCPYQDQHSAQYLREYSQGKALNRSTRRKAFSRSEHHNRRFVGQMKSRMKKMQNKAGNAIDNMVKKTQKKSVQDEG
jgi:hypothetical protein